MASNRVEFLFLKSSIEQFIKDLKKFEEVMTNKNFSEEEVLEIMSYLVAAKENIEFLEVEYSKLGVCCREEVVHPTGVEPVTF